MTRKKIRFMLLDFPDDEEVDASLSTECEIIKAILVSRRMGGRIKHMRFSSLDSLERVPNYEYDPKFVHISGHGADGYLSLLGGNAPWTDIAEDILAPRLKPLVGVETRILFVSTCHSSAGVDRILNLIPDRFTGAYYFSTDSVPFADALTVASMFYRKKMLNDPHEHVLAAINGYFGRPKRLFYRNVP